MFRGSNRHTDNRYLQRALDVALDGFRTSWPNPSVGCVIVRHDGGPDGADLVVGEGFHARAGEPHAEVNALGAAGAAARGATAYVTLEPCNHTGRTGPCSQALIDAGVSRVVIGMADPNPRARGGAEALRAAGIEVEFAPDPSPFEYHLRGWLKRLRVGSPFVTVKVGLSIDGSVALERGVRTAITGPSGREVTDSLRRHTHCTLVSSMTVQADDPQLLAKDELGSPLSGQPLRAVLCQTQLPPDGSAVLVDGLADTALLVPAGTAVSAHAHALAARSNLAGGSVRVLEYDHGASIGGALEVLAREGVGDLLVEAGPRLLTAMVLRGLVDELVTVTAGGFLGQKSLHAWSGEPTVGRPHPPEAETGATGQPLGETLEIAPILMPTSSTIHGDVVVTTWHPRSGADLAPARPEE